MWESITGRGNRRPVGVVVYFPQPLWNRSARVVVNEVEGKEHDCAAFATFSPDSSRLAYVIARDGKNVLVFGGHEGKLYDRFIVRKRHWREEGPRDNTFAFDEAVVLHAIALRGDEVIRLSISLSPQ